MEILLAVHRFPPDSLGGTEQYTLGLARRLRASGHQVHILTYAPGDTPAIERVERDYDEFHVTALAFATHGSDNPILDEYDHVGVARTVRDMLTRHRPDVLHATHLGYLTTSLLEVAHDLGIPTVFTVTDMWPVCPNGLLLRSDGQQCEGPGRASRCIRCYAHMGPRGARYARLADAMPDWALAAALSLARCPFLRRWRHCRWAEALSSRLSVVRERLLRADALLCPSDFLRGVLIRNGYPPAKLRLSPHGIADPSSLRRESSLADGPAVRFGYIGPLAHHKGAHIALEAFAKLASDKATLAYCGALPQGNQEDRYAQALVQRMGELPRVQHSGPVAHERMRDILGSLDVVLVPSLCYENTPTVIYEALASGTPVIASDQGGMAELVNRYGGGWLTPRGDALALARLMQELVANRERIRVAARQIKSVPNLDDHVSDVRRVYGEVVRGRSAHG